jgi:hypothetical protein
MMPTDPLLEIVASYRKHGWQLRRVLLTDTEARLALNENPAVAGAAIELTSLDALWFSRPSHQGREAWELRLIAETPYALFETFEPDETEEERDEVRMEMEARMREYVSR